MDWTEIKIKVKSEDLEKASSISHMVVPYGIYIEDYTKLEEEVQQIAHINLIDKELLNKDRTHGFVHVYISPEKNPNEAVSFIKERFSGEKIENEIFISSCKIEDWINNWKKYFKPTAIGEKLLICPAWEEKFNPGNRRVLKIEPGLAFGTGTHETTRLCLELLESYVTKDSKVLDIGCGSGILSIAALLLGAKSAVGVDIDAVAVKTAVENASINKLENKFLGVCGNLTNEINDKFDIVVANIVADVLIKLNCDIKKFMKPNAVYIISGIIDIRETDLLEVLPKDLEVIKRKVQNNWVALVLKLKN
ncbi:MAG: Ribosomal protein L11 methyltransferase [Eubacteriales bacterium SKADARSKE-1]|nr:Ribosomal protein L11 methyltransferase [Eubacteriales bacterium SKADARSKE-1]